MCRSTPISVVNDSCYGPPLLPPQLPATAQWCHLIPVSHKAFLCLFFEPLQKGLLGLCNRFWHCPIASLPIEFNNVRIKDLFLSLYLLIPCFLCVAFFIQSNVLNILARAPPFSRQNKLGKQSYFNLYYFNETSVYLDLKLRFSFIKICLCLCFNFIILYEWN